MYIRVCIYWLSCTTLTRLSLTVCRRRRHKYTHQRYCEPQTFSNSYIAHAPYVLLVIKSRAEVHQKLLSPRWTIITPLVDICMRRKSRRRRVRTCLRAVCVYYSKAAQKRAPNKIFGPSGGPDTMAKHFSWRELICISRAIDKKISNPKCEDKTKTSYVHIGISTICTIHH